MQLRSFMGFLSFGQPSRSIAYLRLALFTGGLGLCTPQTEAVSASGGTVTNYTQNGTNFTVHTFANSGTLLVTAGGTVEYLVVGGGGGGGGGYSGGNWTGGGGGGAGGYRCSVAGEWSGSNSPAESVRTLTAGAYTIGVGNGGAGGSKTNDGVNGADSYIQDPNSVDVVRALGGGGGAGARWFTRRDGRAGGSGGGGAGNSPTSLGGSGMAAQGYKGGNVGANRGSGGGGGAGGAGLSSSAAGTDPYGQSYSKTHGGSGGPGLISRITGMAVQRAAGGGGGCDETYNYLPGFGGTGGGGKGGTPTFTAGQAGSATTGSGGGGGTQAAGGAGGSGIVIVRYVTVPMNQAPVAQDQSVTTDEDTAKAITLAATDADNDALTYTLLTPPAHGTLAGTAPNLTYTPAANHNGADSFTFQVNDGALDSPPATVTLTVTSVNDAPTATATATPTSGTAPLAVSFSATGADVDGDALSYAWAFGDGATATEQNPSHTYSTAGSYTATVTVVDSQGGSASASISVVIAAPATPPPSSGVPTPVITPAGGSFDQPLPVTISGAVPAELFVTPGWRTGVKYPGQGYESVTALSYDSATVAAMRGRTSARSRWMFPGASMSPDSGLFPFYIWSLADLSATYLPSLFAGVTENTAWDGNNYDFWYAETGNRVFILLQQHYTGTGADISLWSCAAGLTQGATPQQSLASFARMPMSTFAGQAICFEFAAEKVRLLVGTNALTSATTDAAGWVTYTGTNGSGRVTAPLGATRFWLTLAGGDPVGSREMIISDKPKVVTRFTYDGTPVTNTSPVVTNTLTLTRDATLRARAYSAALGGSAEALASFTSNIPLLPSASYVSPANISIPHATLDGTPAQVSLEGPFGRTNGLAIGAPWYLFRYPLLPDAPTPLTLRRNGLPDLTGNVLWRALEIGVSPDTQIHLGESVILSASNTTPGELVIQVTDATGAVVAAHSTLTAAPCTFPLRPDRAGTYTAVALLNGVSIGTLVITVIQVDLQGPIACQIGFRREKEVFIYGPAGSVYFTSSDPTLLEVSVKETTPRGVRLYLKPLKAGTPLLQARLGSPTGPILAQQEVDEFALSSQAVAFIGVVGTFPDGSKLLQTNLQMDPLVQSLTVRMHIIIRGVTFEDSTLDKTINTNEFTFDAASGKWLCPYRLISTPDLFTGSCHTMAIYQGSDQVGL